MVRAHLFECLFLMYSKIVDDFHQEIRKAIPDLVECLKDGSLYVRMTAIDGLVSIAAHGTYPSVPF